MGLDPDLAGRPVGHVHARGARSTLRRAHLRANNSRDRHGGDDDAQVPRRHTLPPTRKKSHLPCLQTVEFFWRDRRTRRRCQVATIGLLDLFGIPPEVPIRVARSTFVGEPDVLGHLSTRVDARTGATARLRARARGCIQAVRGDIRLTTRDDRVTAVETERPQRRSRLPFDLDELEPRIEAVVPGGARW
jgi:hypothetical protein